jgi:ATP-dependent Zn protease
MKKQNKNILTETKRLQEKLKKSVFGQEKAIDMVVEALMSSEFMPSTNLPKAIFTFLGPPECGKSFLAEKLFEYLKEYKDFKTFDMSRFCDVEDEIKLFGQFSQSGTHIEGELTKYIKENPKSIIYFKEIDKSGNKIQLELLNFLTDKNINLSHNIVIFSLSFEKEMFKKRDFLESFEKERIKSQAIILDGLSKEKKIFYESIVNLIEPKLLSFMSEHHLIIFNRLGIESIAKIGEVSMKNVIGYFAKKTGIDIVFEDISKFSFALSLSLLPYLNAKYIKKKLPETILYKISDLLKTKPSLVKQIHFLISKEAEEFLEEFKKSESSFFKKLIRKLETISIKWQKIIDEDKIELKIEKLSISKLPQKKIFEEEKPAIVFSRIGFNDIVGHKETKKRLRSIIKIFKNPKLVENFKIKPPRGIFLYGPESVGKSMLAHAFAKEADVPCVTISGGELFDIAYVKKAYEKAKTCAPSIVILEDINIKGYLNGTIANIPFSDIIKEIETLPSDIDEYVFTIATGTDIEDIDPELIAPNKLDITIEIQKLDKEARRFFIDKILKKPNDGKIDAERIVRYITGMGAMDLKRLGRMASLYAIEHGKKEITEEILIEQINIIKYGHKLESKRVRNLEEELKMTAFHEAGHAVASYLLLPFVKIEQVTISPRSEMLGFVSYNAEEDIATVSKDEIFNDICVLLAGRVAKIEKFGKKGIDTGSAEDLSQATFQAYSAIANLGMDEELGPINISSISSFNDRIFDKKIEERVQIWLKKAEKKTQKIVKKEWKKIDKLAKLLIEKELVEGAELEKLMKSE